MSNKKFATKGEQEVLVHVTKLIEDALAHADRHVRHPIYSVTMSSTTSYASAASSGTTYIDVSPNGEIVSRLSRAKGMLMDWLNVGSGGPLDLLEQDMRRQFEREQAAHKARMVSEHAGFDVVKAEHMREHDRLYQKFDAAVEKEVQRRIDEMYGRRATIVRKRAMTISLDKATVVL